MSIQHASIPDNQLHESKGVATAAANTFYRANGAGTGTWDKLKSSDLTGVTGDSGSSNQKFISNGSNGFISRLDSGYGGMNVSANTNGFSVTAAVDATLNTTSDYVLFTGTGAPLIADPNNFAVTFNTNRLIVPVTGVYKLDLYALITSWPTATKLSFKYKINGTVIQARKFMTKAPATATDPGFISGFELIGLTAADYVQLFIASSVTGSVIVQDMSMALTLLRQTA